MDAQIFTRPVEPELPDELAERLDALVARMAAASRPYFGHADRQMALRIALARGLDAIDDDARSPLG